MDDAILLLVVHMNKNTAIQDHLQSAEQEPARPCIVFCQWMGLEMAKLDEPLWTNFMDEAFTLVTCYKWAQSHQPHQFLLVPLQLCHNHQCSHSRSNLQCGPGVHLHRCHPHSDTS